MDDKKNKKKTLTISTSFNKKIDISAVGKGAKKSFSISKKNLLGHKKIIKIQIPEVSAINQIS